MFINQGIIKHTNHQAHRASFLDKTMSQMIYPYENGHPDVRTGGDDSLFSTVDPAPPVEIFALHKAYHEDNHAMKVDLTIGGKYFFSQLNI